MLVQRFARDELQLDQQVADALVAMLGLRVDGRLQLLGGDRSRFHEHVTDAIAAIHDRRVGDAPLVEVDVSEVVPVRDAEAAGLFPHREELENVRERRFAQRALDGH